MKENYWENQVMKEKSKRWRVDKVGGGEKKIKTLKCSRVRM